MFLHSIFMITSVQVCKPRTFITRPPRFAKLSFNSQLSSFRFVVLIPQSKFLRGGEVWRQRYLASLPTVLLEPQPSYFLVVAKVTTTHLNLESSRSFEVPINTRIPKHPALLTLLLFLCYSLLFLLLVYSVYLGYEPEGSPHGVRYRGAGGGRPPPQILEETFSIHSAPPDFGGFCSEMF